MGQKEQSILKDFNESFDCDIKPEIKFIYKNCLKIRNEIAEKLGLDKSDNDTELAEFMGSDKGEVVVVFPERCCGELNLKVVLFHEFGHCLAFEKNKELILRGRE